jgi:hypothetical protein
LGTFACGPNGAWMRGDSGVSMGSELIDFVSLR